MDQIGDASVQWDPRAEGPFAGPRLRRIEPLIASIRHGRLRVRLPNGARSRLLGRRDRASGDSRDRALAGVSPAGVRRRHRLRRSLSSTATGPAPTPSRFSASRPATRSALDALLGRLAIVRLANRLRHVLRGNTRRGSRRNIMAHYDLGNAFYALWLDPEMQYSSAIWTADTPDLEAAQAAKLDRIVDWLALRGGERVLEIGCGWGALATRLAETQGAQVTALTLSPAQLAYARARAARARAARASTSASRTIATSQGRFDRIVSIEMIEAVGEARWPLYFRDARRVA